MIQRFPRRRDRSSESARTSRTTGRRAAEADRASAASPTGAVQRAVGNQATRRLIEETHPAAGSGLDLQRFYGVVENPKQGVDYQTVQGTPYEWITEPFDAAAWEVSPIRTGWLVYSLYRRTGGSTVASSVPDVEDRAPQNDVPSEKQPSSVDEPIPQPQPEPTKPTTYQGVVGPGKGDGFQIVHPVEGPLLVVAGGFKLAQGQTVTYTIEIPNRYVKKAIVVGAADRPQATSKQVEINEANDVRTEAVRSQGLLNPSKVVLVGVLNRSGARKHYRDADAIARSDSDVIELIKRSPFAITKTETLIDQFTIDVGRSATNAKLGVVGKIVYKDSAKTVVRTIEVFHVGPAQ